LALAAGVETTTRHLSYIENGRSRPGRDLVLRVARALELPLRARNDLLLAAGLAPEFPAHALQSVPLAPYRRAVEGVLAALDPFPAFVVDPLFNCDRANRAGHRLLPALAGGPLNLLDVFLAPGPTRALLHNFAEVAWSLEARVSRAIASQPASAGLDAFRRRLAGYLKDVPRPPDDASGELALCPTFSLQGTLLRTVGMTLHFGPSRDVTLEELSVEVLYPRDDEAERYFRGLADAR
jgi:transcriptional regulator with XRE-family HTH domain